MLNSLDFNYQSLLKEIGFKEIGVELEHLSLSLHQPDPWCSHSLENEFKDQIVYTIYGYIRIPDCCSINASSITNFQECLEKIKKQLPFLIKNKRQIIEKRIKLTSEQQQLFNKVLLKTRYQERKSVNQDIIQAAITRAGVDINVNINYASDNINDVWHLWPYPVKNSEISFAQAAFCPKFCAGFVATPPRKLVNKLLLHKKQENIQWPNQHPDLTTSVPEPWTTDPLFSKLLHQVDMRPTFISLDFFPDATVKLSSSWHSKTDPGVDGMGTLLAFVCLTPMEMDSLPTKFKDVFYRSVEEQEAQRRLSVKFSLTDEERELLQKDSDDAEQFYRTNDQQYQETIDQILKEHHLEGYYVNQYHYSGGIVTSWAVRSNL